MITFTKQSIFDVKSTAYMVPVNSVGIMGAGLALAYKKRYPAFLDGYREACKTGACAIGNNYYAHMLDGTILIAAATKQHWRDPSKLEYVEKALQAFRWDYAYREIDSVAIPALGCGLGGLEWRDVKSLIIEILGESKFIDITVCEPR